MLLPLEILAWLFVFYVFAIAALGCALVVTIIVSDRAYRRSLREEG